MAFRGDFGMKGKKLLLLAILLPAALSTAAFAQQGQATNGYTLLTTIQPPGGFTGGDIAWIDSANARMYLADRGNATVTPVVPPRIDVIDTLNNAFITAVPLPASPNGPNGVVAVPRAHEIWVGMNDSTVVVISTDTFVVKHVIQLPGKGISVTPAARSDELAYDPEDRIIMIANDRDNPPFVSFIDAQNYDLLKTLTFNGTSAPAAFDSTGAPALEQPVWNETTYKFYFAIPATKDNPNGEIDEVDPLLYTVTRRFPTKCMGPSGLTLISNQRLITACGDIIDIASGSVITTVPGVAADEIYYSSTDQRVYFPSSTHVFVVDSNNPTAGPLATLTVGAAATATSPAMTTHQVAVDEVNHEVFVPVSNFGIEVWKDGSAMFASPSTIAAGGTTTLVWNTPAAQTVEIHVGSASGPMFGRGGPRGSAQTGTWVTDGMTFYLQDVTNNAPLTPANTLATVVVHVSH
jgi:hypothetical protein